MVVFSFGILVFVASILEATNPKPPSPVLLIFLPSWIGEKQPLQFWEFCCFFSPEWRLWGKEVLCQTFQSHFEMWLVWGCQVLLFFSCSTNGENFMPWREAVHEILIFCFMQCWEAGLLAYCFVDFFVLWMAMEKWKHEFFLKSWLLVLQWRKWCCGGFNLGWCHGLILVHPLFDVFIPG